MQTEKIGSTELVVILPMVGNGGQCMTHNELLTEVQFHQGFQMGIKGFQLCSALRAVVELHRPEAQEHGEYEKCWNCSLLYPCPTIQAIKKELG